MLVSEDIAAPATDQRRSNSLVTSNGLSRLSLPNVDHIQQLRREVDKLKQELLHTQEAHQQKMEQLVREEQDIRNENLRLQRKLQLEVSSFPCSMNGPMQIEQVDRREQLCRQLSESESSLEMDEERALNERIKAFPRQQRTSSSHHHHLTRSRTVSSPSSNNPPHIEHSSSTSTDFQRPRPPSTSLDTATSME